MNIYPPGTRIGQYEIAGRPLMGGMGIVYLCLDLEEDRPVALKTFKPQYLPDRAARDRFLREGTRWVDLGRHPHVVRCYNVLYIDPEVYLVLELVAKEQGRDDASLRSWLTPGQPLPVEQSLLFALQIARGMKHAASVIPGFVHRDLKPENVLVGADRLSNANVNRLRVTDFGLASALQEAGEQVASTAVASDQVGRTQLTHGVVGTPLYMAPEQWRGEDVTVATDIYALGCILFEMLAGQHVVAGHSLAALRQAHCGGDVCPLPPGPPAGVAAIVTHCLALDPGARYGSWEQVEAALKVAYEGAVGHPAPGVEPAAALSREERVAAGWSYSAMGNSYLDIGKAEMALQYFERAQEAGQREGERRLAATGLTHLGLAYTALGDARRAIGFYEQSLEIAREIRDRRGEGNDLGNLGLAYAALGDARRAIGFYEQRLEIAREIGDRGGEGNTLGNLGEAYRQLGDARRAIAYHGQALAILRKIGDRREEGNALGNLGEAYRQLGDAHRAIGYYEQHLEIAREIGNRREEGVTLGNLGIAYKNLGDARRAIEYYEQALEIGREIGDRRGEGKALNNLGNAYANLGDVRQAIGYYEQALEILREIGDQRGQGNVLMGLGHTYADLGDARRAIEYYEQQLVITREIGDQRGVGDALNNLGLAYATLGDTRRAIQYHEQALAIYREIGDVLSEAMASANLAMSLSQAGRVSEAIPLIEQAIRDFRQAGYPQQAQKAEQMLGEIRGGGAESSGPSRSEILQQFALVIEAVVATARGNRQARAAVEATFGQFERGGWRIVEPIQRIWAGERDEAALTAGLDDVETLIICQILNQLSN